MLHTIKMIKRYYPQFADHKVVVLSPCYAKKREFEETGLGDYNVTYKSLDNYFKKNSIELFMYPEVDYDNPPAERAVLFSTPGGLLRTAEREMPGIGAKTRKIEGVSMIYKYLDHLADDIYAGCAPLIIDCLNCDMGCNGGPATLNIGKSHDRVEYYIEKRAEKMQEHYNKTPESDLSKNINDYWEPNIYKREYQNLSGNNTIKIPNKRQIDDIYQSMMKFSDADVYNCSACGYNICEQMAIAIFNGLNKPENCHYYKESVLKNLSHTVREELHGSLDRLMESNDHQTESVLNMSSAITQYTGTIDSLKSILNNQNSSIDVTATAMQELFRGVEFILDNSKIVKESAVENVDLAQTGEKSVSDVVAKVIEFDGNMNQIYTQIQSVLVMSEKIENMLKVISNIAKQTNLLSLNAAIEAARAGEHGRGFTIVADEVKKLADHTSKLTKEIGDLVFNIKDSIESAVSTADIGLSLSVESKDKAMTAKESMIKLISSIKNIAEKTEQIARINEEQKLAAENVLDSTEKLNRLAIDTHTNLDEQVSALNDIVFTFEVVKKSTTENHDVAKGLKVITTRIEEAM